MRVVHGLEGYRQELPRPVATIGNFDGIHLGHQQLIRDLVKRASEIKGTATVVTFFPHPLQVLAPNNAPRQIQTLHQKLSMLACLGVDLAIVIPFTRELAQTSARDFAVGILWETLGLLEVYVGPNFAFGHRREGSFNLLKEIGEEKGFAVGKIRQVQFRGSRVSSTGIRQALLAGQAALARRLLGRPFALEGEIVHGTRAGAGMSIPTANLRTGNELVPRSGVYATTIRIEGRRYRSLTNIGVRPTVTAGQEAPVTIETHIPGFGGDIYGAKTSLEFLLHLREERRFPGIEALVAQIRRDIARAGRYFEWLGRVAPDLITEQAEVC